MNSLTPSDAILTGDHSGDGTPLPPIGRKRRLGTGEVLYCADEPALSAAFVASGALIERIGTSVGEEVIARLICRGEWCRPDALIGPTRSNAWTVALTDCVVIVVHRFDVQQAPDLGQLDLVLALAAVRVERDSLLDRIAGLGRRSAAERVVAALAYLARRFTTAGTTSTLPVTHDQLAQLAAVTRPTVSAVLADAVDRKILLTFRRRIVVLDPAALAAWAV